MKNNMKMLDLCLTTCFFSHYLVVDRSYNCYNYHIVDSGYYMSKGTFVIALLLFMSSAVCASESVQCSVNYKPEVGQKHFAAVGTALIDGEKICINDTLIIPYTQKSQAVTLQQGEYEAIYRDEKSVRFKTITDSGQKIDSCLICDPLVDVIFEADNPSVMCVNTVLGIKSCAEEKSIAYTFGKSTKVTSDICVKSLIYLGVNDSTLRFKYQSCKADDKNANAELSYDLRYGTTIRMLDELFEIIKADNTGLHYIRLGSVGDKQK